MCGCRLDLLKVAKQPRSIGFAFAFFRAESFQIVFHRCEIEFNTSNRQMTHRHILQIRAPLLGSIHAFFRKRGPVQASASRLDRIMCDMYYICNISNSPESSIMSELLSKRVMTPMSETLISEINNFRFETRRESQADAVRELVKRGLESWREEKAAKAKKKPA